MKPFPLFILIVVLIAATTGCFAPVFGADKMFEDARHRMVTAQIADRGVRQPAVISAMKTVPRHKFVPEALAAKAYNDTPLPIGEGQTISQPYIVALMTECLDLKGDEKVLEIGTGSGYQAAVLAEMTPRVFSIEIKEQLAESARKTLDETGYRTVRSRSGDGYYGWPEEAPFDAIMITAAVDHIPPPLLAQLKDGGKLVLPLGNPFSYQNLVLVTRKGVDYTVRQITGVLFVPMTGRAMQ